MFLVAPQGFEPRLIGSEPTVLPLNEGATGCFWRREDSLTTSTSVRASPEAVNVANWS